jgi:CzcA family heavy metal efflux pump
MLNTLIRFSLKNRFLVLIAAIVMMAYGLWVGAHLPVDVFPNLNRPTVTILTEAHGLAPEEVETLVTLPLETALNGLPGATRIRSSSGIGISVITVEFDWNSDIYRNRQFVFERLQRVSEQLPKDMTPIMGPITSIMGEIQFIGVRSDNSTISESDLRTFADWTLRTRLMSIPGINQVIVMGGDVKEYQILVSTEKLQQKGISLEDFQHALSEISENTTGGFIEMDEKEFLIRPMGRVTTLSDIEMSVVGMHLGRPVLVTDVATVQIGAKTKRGKSSINGQPAVVMSIQKQPDADTLVLTATIEELLNDMRPTLPEGITIHSDLFKQSKFIEAANHNVVEALRDGAIIVGIVLFIFLLNIRTTTITLITIPLSLLISAIVFHWFGLGINTMTLGGFAIAMGELVDDAIVDVENVLRRLRENHKNKTQKGRLRVIFEASSEVRNAIIFSTMTVVLVFLPLFFLSGIEGRLFAPLGLAYIISLLASLFVSLTVTPVLCSFLLTRQKLLQQETESRFILFLKNTQRRILLKTFNHPYLVMAGCAMLLVMSLSLLPFMGQNFLPTFNEGSATIGIAATPGISLTASDALGSRIEQAILSVPEVKSTVRRTGRAEMDEHAEGVHWNEIDVDFKENGRKRADILQDIREKIAAVDSHVYVNIGQPISHRMDHLLSGVRAQIAVKIVGADLTDLRRLGVQIESLMSGIPGIVDLSLEPVVPIPQIKIAIDREAASEKAIRPGELAQDLDRVLNGEPVGQFIDKQQFFQIIMKLDEDSKNNPEKLEHMMIKTMPNGDTIRLADIATVYESKGPNIINRENMQRRLIISANAAKRDLTGIVADLHQKLETVTLPQGYFIAIEGQFESQQRASRLILGVGILSLLAIVGLLYSQFRSLTLVAQIMLNIPLALIGSIVAIYLTQRELSVATLIAFITLCGIASRNGIMMISHYVHLAEHENEPFSKNMVLRGSAERLIPVLMTALTAAFALVPLLLSQGEPGKEILYPVAVVIVGGLVSSTLLDLVVTPTLFYRFGHKALAKHVRKTQTQNTERDWL